jgi:hypothetical protein
MTILFTIKESEYIDFSNGTCSEKQTPPDVLASIKKKDDEYFRYMGEHLIDFLGD